MEELIIQNFPNNTRKIYSVQPFPAPLVENVLENALLSPIF